jgi:hypothetical protein
LCGTSAPASFAHECDRPECSYRTPKPGDATPDGYAAAFYEIAAMLGIPAQSATPQHVWEAEMRPRLLALTADPTSEAVERLTIADAWDILLNVDDRTSPEEYPDMCLITRDELERFMLAALATNAPEKVNG